MGLRVGFDLDGTLADFESVYLEIEKRLFGVADEAQASPDSPDDERRDTPPAATTKEAGLPNDRREMIWREIEGTVNFWITLAPIDPTIVPRIREMAQRYRWDVFFITNRPETAGDTVQRQTQDWLVRQGFDLPSVLAMKGSRGRLAEALCLDFLIDDSAHNCVDVLSESNARPVLVLRNQKEDAPRPQKARQLGVLVLPSISACLDHLEEQETRRSSPPSLMQRVARFVGLRA